MEIPIGVDFETEAIAPRPHYPPKPVSVSVIEGGQRHFWSWGHPVGNNCSERDARTRLKKVYASGRPLVFHNAKFDLDVGTTHLGLPRVPWERAHDTMFLAFLDNPDRSSLSLGPVSAEVLKRKPWKEGALKEWIISHVPGATGKNFGAHISLAPAQLVQSRAVGDAANTVALWQRLYPRIVKASMQVAYERERRLLWPLIDNETRGVRVAHGRLRRDLALYEKALAEVDQRLRKILKAPDLDLDKRGQLALAMDDAGLIDEWVLTPKGNKSTSKASVMTMLKDKKLVWLLTYRGALATCIRTFMRPWLLQADVTHGRIHTRWNQVRSDYHDTGGSAGAKTGRLSSSPNLQNILNNDRVMDIINALIKYKLIPAVLAALGMPALPNLRDYVIADEGQVIIVRDYSQQELRILAHFEDGSLLEAYQENNQLDVHNWVRDIIAEMIGVTYDRRPVKDTNFGILYGMGVGKLAKKIDKPVQEAAELRRAVKKAMPGVADLERELKAMAGRDEPLRTWGGRLYYCEPPAVRQGHLRTFEYKQLNRLIQGSAADNTKEAICRYHEAPTRHSGDFLLTVHDEHVGQVDKGKVEPGMKVLRETMESVEFDVPMLSDGKVGPSWGRLKKFNDRRKG